MADGKVLIDTRLNNSGLAKDIQNIKGMLGGLNSVVKKLGLTLAAVFSVRKIASFMVDSSKAAMSLSDALTGLRSILEGQGKSFSAAQSFIEEYTSDGLIPATNAITAYKNLASRGYDDSQIQQVMLALKDASAYGRQASYTMGEAVQSATEGLKNENSILVDNAGVTKNVAKMWEEYAESIGTTANNLTQQQKIQAEVNGILEESKYQAGDAATVANTLSGQLQQLSFNFNNLKVAVGNAINPIVQSFLPIINTAISTLVRFANAVATVVGLIFGKVSTSAGDLAASNDSVASSASAGAAAEEELADATEAAGKAAKKSLAGFDELNKLQGDSGSGSSSSTSAGVSSGGSTTITVETEVEDTVSPKFQAIADKIQELLAPLREIDFTPAIESFGRLGEAAGGLGETIGEGLQWAWENILVPLAEWTIEEAVPAFLDLLSAALDFLNSVLETFQPLAQWLWDSFLAPIAEWTGGVIVDVLGWIADGLTAISDWITNNQELVEAIVIVIGSFAAAWALVNAAVGLGNAVVGLWNTISTVAAGVTTAFGAAVSFLTSPIGLVTLAIGALIAIVVLLVRNWDKVKEVAGKVWEEIKSVWNTVATWFDEHVIQPVAKFFSDLWEGFSSAASDAWDAVCKVFSDVAGFFEEIFSNAWQGIVDVFSIAGDIFTDIKDGILTAFKTIVNGIIKGLNTVIAIPFDGINSALEFVRGINILGLTPFSGLKTISVPQIPELAKGAVLPANKPFLAMVGDQKHGTNVEAPLSTIQEAVALVMDDMLQGQMAGFEAVVAVLKEILEAIYGIEIGDEVIAKAAQRYQAKMAIVKGRV